MKDRMNTSQKINQTKTKEIHENRLNTFKPENNNNFNNAEVYESINGYDGNSEVHVSNATSGAYVFLSGNNNKW